MYHLKTTKGTKDLIDAINLRIEVFVIEQGFHDEFDQIDQSAIHFLLYDGKKAIATARVYKISDTVYEIGRVCVAKNFRRKGVGRQLLKKIEKQVLEWGGSAIKLNAQLQAADFHKKLGYHSIGSIKTEQGCRYIEMNKSLSSAVC